LSVRQRQVDEYVNAMEKLSVTAQNLISNESCDNTPSSDSDLSIDIEIDGEGEETYPEDSQQNMNKFELLEQRMNQLEKLLERVRVF
jgi:hypothetical protein